MNADEIKSFTDAVVERNRAERELSSARELIGKIAVSATVYMDNDWNMAQLAQDWLSHHKPLDTPA